MTVTPLLAVDKLEVVYHRAVTAVQGITLAVAPGQIVAILGTNGAGKTTCLRAISGFLGIDDARVTDGTIAFNGERIDKLPPHAIARRGVVLVPERDKVFESLTVAENLRVPVSRGVFSWSHFLRKTGAHFSGKCSSRTEDRRREETAYQFFPRLHDIRGRLAGLLSGGERQMLAFAGALMCAPQVLLVDELSLGLAPVVVEDLMRRLADIRRELNLAVLMVEQSAAVALAVADYGYVLENGRVVLDGTAARLAAHGDIQEFYLGGAGAGAERRSYRAVKQYRRSRRWYG